MLHEFLRNSRRIGMGGMGDAALSHGGAYRRPQPLRFQSLSMPVASPAAMGHSLSQGNFHIGGTENHEAGLGDPQSHPLADAVNIYGGANDALGRTPGALGKAALGINDAFSVGQALSDPNAPSLVGGARGMGGLMGSMMGKNLLGPLGTAMNVYDGATSAANLATGSNLPGSNQVVAHVMETAGKGATDIMQNTPAALPNVI